MNRGSKHLCTTWHHYYNSSKQLYKWDDCIKERRIKIQGSTHILGRCLPSVWYPQYLDLTSVIGKHSSPLPARLPTFLTFSLKIQHIAYDVSYFLLDNALGYFLNRALKLIRVIFFPSVFPTYCQRFWAIDMYLSK